ncbi:MAG: SGNH/GDSL hydrolase family protein, partial [Gammaproteobacteria bacterium]|nr:SGNH/GDSL hydrolase family protein [Gammaproteobacteria bacterium]
GMSFVSVTKISKNIALVLSSLVLAFAVLVVIEFLVRWTTDVGRLGTSADLFVNQAYGESIGNAPNAKTIAFGVEVYTDDLGFRTNSNGATPVQNNDEVILILGDSVAFGVGVEFEETVAARLASAFPEFHLLNSAVISYGINDYENVNNVVFPRYAGAIKQALVIFCLNDVSVISASTIRTTVTHATTDLPTSLSAGIDVQSLKAMPLVNSLNSFLRARSSLYVWVRGSLTDPQTRYWKNELANYDKLSEETLAQILGPIDRIARLYDTAEIPFSVFVMPFAGQMESDESSLPQKNITAFLASNGIAYVDLLPRFRTEKLPKDLFLPYDPMHLSPDGHEVLFQVIREQISNRQSASLER